MRSSCEGRCRRPYMARRQCHNPAPSMGRSAPRATLRPGRRRRSNRRGGSAPGQERAANGEAVAIGAVILGFTASISSSVRAMASATFSRPGTRAMSSWTSQRVAHRGEIDGRRPGLLWRNAEHDDDTSLARVQHLPSSGQRSGAPTNCKESVNGRAEVAVARNGPRGKGRKCSETARFLAIVGPDRHEIFRQSCSETHPLPRGPKIGIGGKPVHRREPRQHEAWVDHGWSLCSRRKQPGVLIIVGEPDGAA